MSKGAAPHPDAIRSRVAPPAPILATILAACLLLFASCADFAWRGYKIDNQTTVAINVTSTMNGKETVLVSDIQPGLYQPITGYPGHQCVQMLLIARDTAGDEVDRRDGEVCLDQTWIVKRTEGS